MSDVQDAIKALEILRKQAEENLATKVDRYQNHPVLEQIMENMRQAVVDAIAGPAVQFTRPEFIIDRNNFVYSMKVNGQPGGEINHAFRERLDEIFKNAMDKIKTEFTETHVDLLLGAGGLSDNIRNFKDVVGDIVAEAAGEAERIKADATV